MVAGVDKYEFKLKVDEMKALVDARNYKAAAEIAETINWRKIRNLNALVLAGEIFEQVQRYGESKEILLLAYDKSPIGRNIIYRLAEIAIKTKNFEEAKEYYDEFVDIAPHDNLKFVLKYKMTAAQGLPYENQIHILEELKEQEYSEEWAYELAYLYHRNDQPDKCVEACDELILWFGDGVYVEKALELKMHYQPLTKTQEEKYRLFRQRRMGVIEVKPEDFLESGEIINEAVQIPSVMTNAGKFNTANLQSEIAKGMQQIIHATDKEDVSGAMDNIKKLAGEIPYLSLQAEEGKQTVRQQEEAALDDEIDRQLDKSLNQIFHDDLQLQPAQEEVLQEEDIEPEKPMSIEEVLAEWEKTKQATQEVLRKADERKLESAKEKALQEAEILLDRLQSIVPQLTAGVTPKELLEQEYLQGTGVLDHVQSSEIQDDLEKAGEIVAGMNRLLQAQIDQLSASDASEEQEKTARQSEQYLVSDPTRELPELSSGIYKNTKDHRLIEHYAQNIQNDAMEEKQMQTKQTEYLQPELENELDIMDNSQTMESEIRLLKRFQVNATQNPEASQISVNKQVQQHTLSEQETTAPELNNEQIQSMQTNEDIQYGLNHKTGHIPLEQLSPRQLEKTDLGETRALHGYVKEKESKQRESWADIKKEIEQEYLQKQVQDQQQADSISQQAQNQAQTAGSAFGQIYPQNQELARAGEEQLWQGQMAQNQTEVRLTGQVQSEAGEEQLGQVPSQTTEELLWQEQVEQNQTEVELTGQVQSEAGEEQLGQVPSQTAEEQSWQDQVAQAQTAGRVIAQDDLSQNEPLEHDTEHTQNELPTEDIKQNIQNPTLENRSFITKPKEIEKADEEEEISEEDMQEAAKEAGFAQETQQLTAEQKQLFSWYISVDGIESQIYQLLKNVSNHLRLDKNSLSGNIVVEGMSRCGKTELIKKIIKVLQTELGRPNEKIGKIDAHILNQKDIAVLVKKVSGGCLIIESAGRITRETAVRLSLCMENDHTGTLYILEDTKENIRKALERDSSFSGKFTEKISVPLFTIDDFVAFARAYANDLDYDIDEMGILAVYKRINSIQKPDHVTSLDEVMEIIDEAISRAEKVTLKKMIGILTATRYNDDKYVVLHEKDFEE